MSLVTVPSLSLNLSPIAIDRGGDHARMPFLGFFTAQIRNANTHRFYIKAA